MMMHRFKVPPRPVGGAALTPAKAAARRVYAQAIGELIDRKMRAPLQPGARP